MAAAKAQSQTPPIPDTTLTSKPIKLKSDSSIVISRDTIIFLIDTISEEINEQDKHDGSDFYEALKRSAYKRRLTKELYHLFFVSPDKINPTEPIKAERSETPFVQYQGKTIREIRISILPPFGPKLYDTTLVAKTWVEKSANNVHHSTRKRTIKRQLHIKPGDRVNASTLADNERLIRELPYIEDAYIRVIPVLGSPSLVDLEIQTKDQFSWGLNINASSLQSADFELYNKNLYGLGHQLNNSIELDSDKVQKLGYIGQYYIKNVGGSFMNTALTYQNTYEKEIIQFDLNKEFETYNTRYAGGLRINRTMRSDRINKNDPIISEIPLDFNHIDFWLGRSFRLKSKTLFTRRKMVVAGRVSSRNFFNRPSVGPDKNQFFHNSTLYLASFSLSQTQYYKSNLIFNFGHTEDIPYGHLIQLTTGIENKEFCNRTYLGINFEKATHRPKSRSYLLNSISIGGFFNEGHFEQGALLCQTKFVSRIRKLGRYRFRNFGHLSYLIGIRRIPGEFIDLNNSNGIRGFKSTQARGNQRLRLNMESVAFSPHMLGGFRFAFFSFADMGVIGSNHKTILTQDYYYGLGLGIRLRNENLVFKTIQLRLAFYPKAPSDFKSGQFKLSGEPRPKFNDFNVERPQIVEYR